MHCACARGPDGLLYRQRPDGGQEFVFEISDTPVVICDLLSFASKGADRNGEATGSHGELDHCASGEVERLHDIVGNCISDAHLIFHDRYRWADDQSRTAQYKRWQLKAHTFASAGGHDQHHIPPCIKCRLQNDVTMQHGDSAAAELPRHKC